MRTESTSADTLADENLEGRANSPIDMVARYIDRYPTAHITQNTTD